MKNFMDLLIEAIEEKENPTVMGLDPNLDFIPEPIVEAVVQRIEDPQERAAEMMFQFNQGLLEAVHGIIPAVKPQLAYYEMYGAPGVEAFARTCRLAKAMGFLVIADGKRNDIGQTAQAYAAGFLGDISYPCGKTVRSFQADALTVNPYLGRDGIMPFLETGKPYGRGIFALVRTSNSSATELQDQRLQGGRTVYEAVADLLLWSGPLGRRKRGNFAKSIRISSSWFRVMGHKAEMPLQFGRISTRMGEGRLSMPPEASLLPGKKKVAMAKTTKKLLCVKRAT